MRDNMENNGTHKQEVNVQEDASGNALVEADMGEEKKTNTLRLKT